MGQRNLTYLDFAADEMSYLMAAYNSGLRFNAMVYQCQRIAEGYLKDIIVKSLMNNDEVMNSHSIRRLYDYVENLGIDLSPIRNDIMTLNNFYSHTRFPSREAYIASPIDIERAVDCTKTVASYITCLQYGGLHA